MQLSGWLWSGQFTTFLQFAQCCLQESGGTAGSHCRIHLPAARTSNQTTFFFVFALVVPVPEMKEE